MSIDNHGIIPADRVSQPDFSTHHCMRSGEKRLGEWKEQFLQLYRLCMDSNSVTRSLGL